jgi:hypothetical protein
MIFLIKIVRKHSNMFKKERKTLSFFNSFDTGLIQKTAYF